MRRTAYVVAALILLGLAVVMPKQVLAVGNVLVPSDDNSVGSSGGAASPSDNSDSDALLPPSSNALIMPGPTAAPTLNVPPPISNPVSSDAIAKALSTLKSAPTDPALLDPSGSNAMSTAQLQASEDALKSFSGAVPRTKLMTPSDIMYSPVSDAEAAQLPLGSIRTMIVRGIDTSAMLANYGKELPYALTLSIGPKSVFGPNDVSIIQDKLGMSRDDIGQSCILTLNGMMQTDKGSYMVLAGASPQAKVRYDGMIKGYMMMGVAKCAYSGKLPPGSGFLTLVAGRFNVPLSLVKCGPPTRQVTDLVVTYDGTETPKCEYE